MDLLNFLRPPSKDHGKEQAILYLQEFRPKLYPVPDSYLCHPDFRRREREDLIKLQNHMLRFTATTQVGQYNEITPRYVSEEQKVEEYRKKEFELFSNNISQESVKNDLESLQRRVAGNGLRNWLEPMAEYRKYQIF